jgi:osmoprotectant transport system substrate-binding protein
MRWWACLVAAFVMIAGCGRRNSIVIGSKNFTEQVILGELAAQQLERKLHVSVERRLNLGGTLLTHEALLKGQIDLYPEYTGTASSAVLKQKVPSDPGAAYLEVKQAYLKRFSLVWLPPLGFNDTFAMVVRQKDAQSLPRADLSSALARSWRLGVGYEFLTRVDGLSSLNQHYHLRWEGTPKTMDLGLLYQAIRQNQVDMAAANSTDGLLTENVYAILADDRKAFPPYSACYVARQNFLRENPAAEAALTLLSSRISDETMRNLNRQVDVEHRAVQRVVQEFLARLP